MSPKRSPGRPTLLEDEDLVRRRNDLVRLLSVCWADIVWQLRAWQLRRTSTREEFRMALKPLSGRGEDHLISHFVRPTSTTTTSKEVRATRKAYETAAKHIPDAHKRYQDVVQLHSQIKAAMMEANPEELKVLQADLAKYETKLRFASADLEGTRTQERILNARLEAQEASFAQAELAKIILENRCARHPLKMANAMAGLPFLSARVSYGRCSKLKCSGWPRSEFLIVKFIESTWNRRQRYPHLSIVELFDQEIKRLRRTVRREELPEAIAVPTDQKRVENYLRSHLAANRRYLRLAIERSLEKTEIAEKRMPFVIASNFSAILEEPRTPLTLALSEGERLDK